MNIEWTLLKDLTDDRLCRGTVFRFPATYPFEDVVDFMLIFDYNSKSQFSLVCTTGYKAGHFEASLPKEARVSGNWVAIDRKWILQNWLTYIYPDTDVSKIYVCENYPMNIGGKVF